MFSLLNHQLKIFFSKNKVCSFDNFFKTIFGTFMSKAKDRWPQKMDGETDGQPNLECFVSETNRLNKYAVFKFQMSGIFSSNYENI